MVSWFMSPWEAARFTMEAQRLVALQFFGFAFPKQSREEHAFAEQRAAVAGRAPSIAPAEERLPPPKGMEPAHKKRSVAARTNTQITKKRTGTRKRKKQSR
jgi:hypothetical protein